MDEGDAYRELRPLLFSIAYRMVGSVSEAEDLVQEAFLRLAAPWSTAPRSPRPRRTCRRSRPGSPSTTCARPGCGANATSATGFQEPLVTGAEADPASHAETADSLSLAFLVLLERLSPLQRAVFLLHEVFGYGYAEIAGLVGRSEDNCRQIAARARRHVEAGRPGSKSSRRQREELARRFFAAVEQGDTEGLVGLLADDVVMYGDGGGRPPWPPRPRRRWGRPVPPRPEPPRHRRRDPRASRRGQRPPRPARHRPRRPPPGRPRPRHRRRPRPDRPFHRQPGQAPPPRAGRDLSACSPTVERPASRWRRARSGGHAGR